MVMDLAHAGPSGSLTLDAATVTAVMALGVFHGLNPGMGWLFAVSFGLQERSRSALLRSLVPIAAGHELSVLPIAVVIVVFASEVTRARGGRGLRGRAGRLRRLPAAEEAAP